MFDKVMRGRDAAQAEPQVGSDEPVAKPTSAPRQEVREARVRNAAVIGPSIHINGDLRGEEDLIIQGEVHGTIQLKEHSLTVGQDGKVFANLYAHTIVVEGKVEGDLYGSERVAIKRSAEVRGNIFSPRVSLEDGGRFKGMIEMDQEEVRKIMGTPQAKSQPTPKSTPAKTENKSQANAEPSSSGA